MLAALTFTSLINQRAGTLYFGGTSEVHVLRKMDYQKLCSESSEIGSKNQMCGAKASFHFCILLVGTQEGKKPQALLHISSHRLPAHIGLENSLCRKAEIKIHSCPSICLLG